MPFKWNDTTERMLLIKFLEQNPQIKLDVDGALAAWPAALDKPTKRSLADRFNLIKKKIRDLTVNPSLGQGTPLPMTATTTPQVARAPPTPTSNAQARAPPTTTLMRKLLASSSSTSKGKRKRDESDESEVSADASSDDDDADDDAHDGDPIGNVDEGHVSARRTSLPRRSKSATPAKYADDDNEDVDGSSETEQDDGDGDEKGVSSDVAVAHAKGNSKKKAKITAVKDDDETEDSDGLFDPSVQRRMERDGRVKKKMSWHERVMMVDGRDEDLEA